LLKETLVLYFNFVFIFYSHKFNLKRYLRVGLCTITKPLFAQELLNMQSLRVEKYFKENYVLFR